MTPEVDDKFDDIDAMLFSGDTFLDQENLNDLNHYLKRWARRSIELQDIINDMGGEEQ